MPFWKGEQKGRFLLHAWGWFLKVRVWGPGPLAHVLTFVDAADRLAISVRAKLSALALCR